jgi:hypothetical protein
MSDEFAGGLAVGLAIGWGLLLVVTAMAVLP